MRATRLTALTLTAVMTTGILAACGQTTTSTSGSTSGASSTATAGSTGSTAANGALMPSNGCTSTVAAASATTSARPTAPAPEAAAGSALAAITASGPVDFKTAPTVNIPTKPVTVQEVTRRVLQPGEGAEATRDSVVVTRMQVYHGTSGKLLDDGFGTDRKDESFQLNRVDLLPGLSAGLLGAKKNERLVIAIPPKDAFGETGQTELGISATDTLVIVADIVDVRAVATSVDGTMTQAPADMPQVQFPNGPTAAPVVTIKAGAAPTETKAFTLIEGSGATVEKGQTLSAHYHGLLWKDCSVFDSSWQRGAPTEFPIGTGGVIPGWDDTLVGKKIGSRVLLVIPPADGYGAEGSPPSITGSDVLVFVVDILDAH